MTDTFPPLDLSTFPVPHTADGTTVELTGELVMAQGRDMPQGFTRLLRGYYALRAINSSALDNDSSPLIKKLCQQIDSRPIETKLGVYRLTLDLRDALTQLNEQLMMIVCMVLENSLMRRSWDRHVETVTSFGTGVVRQTYRLSEIPEFVDIFDPETIGKPLLLEVQEARTAFQILAATGIFEAPVGDSCAN